MAGGAHQAYTMVGAAAMIGCVMQAPRTGLALVLTHGGFGLLPTVIVAVVCHLEGYLICSARLPAYLGAPQGAAASDDGSGWLGDR